MTGWPEPTLGSELFWFAFERSASPMMLLRLDRLVLAMNEACCAALGVGVEAVGRRGDMLVAPDWWRRMEADWTRLRSSGSIAGSREFVRGDGRRVRVRFAARTARLDGRQLVLYVVVEQQLRPTLSTRRFRQGDPQLTPRELQVVSHVATGLRVHEIGVRLGISPATVQTHVRNAMEKVGARSQAHLVALTIADGGLELADLRAALPESPR